MGDAPEPGHCDAVLLAPLTEDTFLHNLHVRYKQDVIYTWVGNALVSVNPCRALPLYSAELVRSYLSLAPYSLPPHVYAVAAGAYRRVRDTGRAQCIVLTGESGSGKTEAARVCLQCCVLAGASAAAGAPAGGAGATLTAAGTLLEAFGNAATALNHNASRFGKLLDIEFDFKGEPIGGHITHLLLEKERACGEGVAGGERNFHVLYQLLAGADVALLKRLRLQRGWEQYRVLRGSRPPDAAAAVAPLRPDPRAVSADKDHFAFTKAAMCALGFASSERASLLRVLAFLLKVGNVEFEPALLIDGELGARLLHAHELEEACAGVGVAADELAAALGAARGGAGADDDDDEASVSSGASAEWAAAGEWCSARRDRLLAALYGRLFTWLVTAVNARLASPQSRDARTLSVLDVYGLESLGHNALERLLINYAAERVQACVTRVALRREQEEYVREGLPWTPLRLPDHDAAADLLDAGGDGVLHVLRDCTLRGLGDAQLLQRLQHRQHPRLHVLPPHHFQVVHFGGAVVYDGRGMAAKNRDGVCRRLSACLARAADPLLSALFPHHSPHSPRPPRRAHTPAGSPRHGAPSAGSLACRQRALVAAACRRVGECEPRLVRCLRADPLLRPRRFDAHLVRHQLRSQGIVEMAVLRRAGWCEALAAREVVSRYGLLCRPPPPPSPPPSACAIKDPAVRSARALLRSLPIPSAEFAFGRTKVFIRSPRTVWELEALRAKRVSRLVSAAQRAWRVHRRRRRERAQAVIARAWRRRRAGARAGRARPTAHAAAALVWRAWCNSARRRYLLGLWRRLPPRHLSPACAAWPPCPWPRLLARADALLRQLHHRWRCLLYRRAFDQTQRNRMREKVTASVLFKGRKALYARSVPHPFVGDYVRLRASCAWRRGMGAAHAHDRYVVFADVVLKLRAHSASAQLSRRVLAVVSTSALLLLDARSLRLRRRVPAHHVYRLSLSPFADDLLVVHVRACSGGESSTEDLSACSSREAGEAAGCLFGEAGGRRRRGDLVVRTCHVLELATKLFLVVQNACGAPPHVTVAQHLEATLAGQPLSLAFHAPESSPDAASTPPREPRLLRRGSHIDVLL